MPTYVRSDHCDSYRGLGKTPLRITVRMTCSLYQDGRYPS
jgi:hypothetical protein